MTTTTAFTRTVGTVGADPPCRRTYPYAAVTITAIAPRTLPCGSRRGSGSWTTGGPSGSGEPRQRATRRRGPRIRPEHTGRGPSPGFAATRRQSRCKVGCSSYRPPPNPRIHAAHGPSVLDGGVRREGFVRRINWLRKSSVSLVPMHVWLIAMDVIKTFVLVIETFII